jgi:HK97 family phage major capsid protein
MSEAYVPRVGVEALMPEEYQRDIIDHVPEQSAVMTYGFRAPDMARAQRRIPCLSALPIAYFSNPGPSSKDEDEQWKRLTQIMWEDKYIEAEEINCIIAIPQAVLDDADYDIWGQARPNIIEAFGQVFDRAVFYGTNAPQVWPDPIVTAATAHGNFVTVGSIGTDIYDDIMGEDGLIAKVEDDGFMVDGYIAAIRMRAKLRGLRDSNKQPIFKPITKEGVQGNTSYMLDGEPCYFPRNGAVDHTKSLLIAGAWKQLMYAIRKDITWKILTEAVVQDPSTKEILYNLAQQNMVGLRCSMRLGWQVPNPINRIQEDEELRYPFSVLGEEQS